jgi:hypothetical protein
MILAAMIMECVMWECEWHVFKMPLWLCFIKYSNLRIMSWYSGKLILLCCKSYQLAFLTHVTVWVRWSFFYLVTCDHNKQANICVLSHLCVCYFPLCCFIVQLLPTLYIFVKLHVPKGEHSFDVGISATSVHAICVVQTSPHLTHSKIMHNIIIVKYIQQIDNKLYEIWGFHSDEYVDTGLLSCNAMWTCR